MSIRNLVQKIPLVQRFRADRRRSRELVGDRAKVFSRIYARGGWGGQSVSGRGSNAKSTRTIREELPRIIHELGVHTLIDAPCGDFYWMKLLDLGVDEYIGIDIVPELIGENTRLYASERRRFLVTDLVEQKLPRGDLVLCRDCLVHLSHSDGLKVVRNIIASRSTYVLTTTFPARTINPEIATGGWRPLNLELPPFCFPRPLRLIDEHCTAERGAYKDKSLGLWRTCDLGHV